MSAIVDEERWRNFFELYRNLPEIWKIKSDGYKNRHRRNRGWRLLLEAYRNIDKNASMERLKHRVNNIRTCYRRELRKIRLSEKLGACPDSVHVPSLWYFNYLDFLKNQESAQTRRWRLRSDETTTEGNNNIQPPSEIQPLMGFEETTEPSTKLFKFKNKQSKTSLEPWIKPISEENTKDEAVIYADSWACSYRKLSPEQQLYAKKAIEEILILGQLNALSLDMVNSAKTSAKPEFGEVFDPHNAVVYNNDNQMQCCLQEA